jgi:oligogalacturonide transport system substrate-binding protein
VKKVIKVFSLLALVVILGVTVLAKPKENVTLRFSWWGGEVRHKATLAAIDIYTKKHPEVRIEPEYGGFDGYQQKILTQMAGKVAPDIMQLDQPWLADLAVQGDILTDLNKYKSLIKLNNFDKNFLANQCSINKKLLGIPLGINATTYVINKELLIKNGIKPDTKWDWDNLLEYGTQIHKADNSVYLLAAAPEMTFQVLKSYIVNQTGKSWVLNDYTLGVDKKTLTDTFTYYRKLFDTGTMLPLEEQYLFEGKPEQEPKWLSGKVGMSPNWASTFSAYSGAKFELGAVLPPIAKNAKNSGVVVRPSMVAGINNYSEHKKEAAMFLNWLLNDPEAVAILNTVRSVPATEEGRKILADKKLLDPNVSLAVNLGIKNAGLVESTLTYNSELDNIFKDVLTKVAFKKLVPEQAADEFINRVQTKLAELKAQK